jgi:kynureninase
VPTPGAAGFQVSTPSPLMLAPLRAALAVFREAGGIAAVRTKSLLLTGFLEWLLTVSAMCACPVTRLRLSNCN